MNACIMITSTVVVCSAVQGMARTCGIVAFEKACHKGLNTVSVQLVRRGALSPKHMVIREAVRTGQHLHMQAYVHTANLNSSQLLWYRRAPEAD